MADVEIGIEQARKTLGDIANRAALAGQTTYLTRNGRRIAAVVPVEDTMTYTVQIEASNEAGDIWQALAPAETFDLADWIADWGGTNWTPDQIAQTVAKHQDVADGDNWRVRVWTGADTGIEPTAEYCARNVTLAELTARLGRPDSDQQAVLAWTNEERGRLWTEAEVAELTEIWAADVNRIDADEA